MDQYIHNLQHATDWRDRRAAAAFLEQFKDDKSLNALIAALRDDSESDVRVSAARALAKRGDPQATGSFISAFNNALGRGNVADAEFKEYAQTLGRLRDKRAVSTLITGLSSESLEGREIVRDILLEEVGEDAVPSLIDALENPDFRILTGAASILSRMGHSVTRPLLEALASPHPSVRMGAAMALGDLKTGKAVQPLVAALEDEDLQVVQEAAKALGRIGMPGIAPLVEGLADPDRHVRLAATKTLGLIDFEEVSFKDADWSKTVVAAIDGLLPVTTDTDQDIRQEAFLSLGALGGILYRNSTSHRDHSLARGILDTLTRALSDEDVHVRAWAAKALGLYGADECVAPLRKLLWEQDVLVKEAAADALTMISKQEAVDTIIEGLEAPEPEVRHVVASSLGRSLRMCLEQPSSELPPRSQPVKALNYMSVPESVSTITSALARRADDPDEHVRKEVQSNLAMFERALPGERGPVRMPCASAPAPAVSLRSSQPDNAEEKESPADTVIETAGTGPTEPRYTDVAFFHDDQVSQVATGEPLVQSEWYRLQVAVKTKPTGVPPTVGERRPIEEPKRDHPATVMVVAEGDDFDIEENIQTFILPPSGDTADPAWFRVRPKKETADSKNLAEISLRLLCDFFYLEKITVQAEVIEKGDGAPISRWGLDKPISIRYDQFEQEPPDMADILPRDMTIIVKKVADKYMLRFLFYNNRNQEIEFPAPLRLDEAALENELIKVRTLWSEIATDKTYLQEITCDEDDFRKHVRKLAEEGSELWNMLFRYDADSALFHIGNWLEDHPLPGDSVIQIIPDDKDSADFVFPWALLHDQKTENGKDPDPMGFWGLRYCIEQRMIDKPSTGDSPVYLDKIRLCFMLWDQFPNSKEHIELFKKLADTTGRIEETSPITDAKVCIRQLKSDWDILYFFTHGHTEPRKTIVGPEDYLQLFISMYNGYAKTDPRKKIFEDLYWAIISGQYEKDKSWIELACGKIYLDELYADKKWSLKKTRPIVFLNMCESAQVVPILREKSFIHVFLNRGASCVIGTECPMAAVFACPFAEQFFEDLLGGDSVGKAALEASRYFMKRKNPLGLAYTVYGSVMHSFKPPPIQRPAEPGSAGQPSSNGRDM